MIIWRAADIDQPPTCVVHRDFATQRHFTPIYLLLDDRRRGQEHYDARIPKRLPTRIVPPTRFQQMTNMAIPELLSGKGQQATIDGAGVGSEFFECLDSRSSYVLSQAESTAKDTPQLTPRKHKQKDPAVMDTLKDIQKAWGEERDKQFVTFGERIGAGNACLVTSEATQTDLQCWIANGSWTFCPTCGRRRPNGKFMCNAAWTRRGRRSVEIMCTGGCDARSKTLLKKVSPSAGEQQDEDDIISVEEKGDDQSNPKKYCTIEAYVTPQMDDWPPELKNLSEKNTRALSVIDLHVDFKNVRGVGLSFAN